MLDFLKARILVWEAAMDYYADCLSQGFRPIHIRRKILDTIWETAPGIAESKSALRRTLSRKIEQFNQIGTVSDLRKGRSGAKRKETSPSEMKRAIKQITSYANLN